METSSPARQYPAKLIKNTSVALVCIGGLSLICGILSLVVEQPYSNRWTGVVEVWAPVVIIAAGIVGIKAVERKAVSDIHMVHVGLSIATSIISFVLLLVTSACTYNRLALIPVALFGLCATVVSIIMTVLSVSVFCARPLPRLHAAWPELVKEFPCVENGETHADGNLRPHHLSVVLYDRESTAQAQNYKSPTMYGQLTY